MFVDAVNRPRSSWIHFWQRCWFCHVNYRL